MLIILFNITRLHTVKWSQVLVCITNNSIKQQSLVWLCLTTRLCSVKSLVRTLVRRGISPLCRDAVGVFKDPTNWVEPQASRNKKIQIKIKSWKYKTKLIVRMTVFSFDNSKFYLVSSFSNSCYQQPLVGQVGWLVGFYCISTFVGYLMPNPFLYK